MTSAQARQLTRVLYAVVAVLAILYLMQLAGLGRGVPGGDSSEPEALPGVQLSETQIDLPGLEIYDDLVQRPLFAEDRRPEPKAPLAEGEPEPEAPPAVPLNVALTGIIHTPNTRVALVRDNSSGRSVNLQERMPLPGDQGSWLVKTIEPRRVVFEDTVGQTETTLELAIGAAAGATGSPTPPAPPGRPQAPAAPTATAEDEVAKRAAEIRRRIEERRAQLRREAEQSKQ